MISDYITRYATDEFDIDKVLEPWHEAKSKYLFTLFGDSLILEKPITIEKSKRELSQQFTNLHWHYDNMGMEHPFIQSFRKKVMSSSCMHLSYSTIYSTINAFGDLFCDMNVLENKLRGSNSYSGPTDKAWDFATPNGHITLRPGTKFMKVLRSIAKEYDILDEYEKYRIDHSKLLNEKTISGTLCLSIHPLDYMTMSDNAHNWTSCMSWRSGEYRVGTLEMMNSPMVIVAYLKSDNKDFEFIARDRTNKWNSKRWRELIILNEDIVINNKSYPYQSDNLTKEVLSWIKDLAKEKLDWDFKPNCAQLNEDMCLGDISIRPYSNLMYNDFDCNDDMFYCHIRENFHDNHLIFNYSGTAYCLTCGGLLKRDGSEESEEALVCYDCLGLEQCNHCGYYRDPSLMMDFNGNRICECCYEDSVKQCIFCKEPAFWDDMSNVYIKDPENPHRKYWYLESEFVCHDCCEKMREQEKIYSHDGVLYFNPTLMSEEERKAIES